MNNWARIAWPFGTFVLLTAMIFFRLGSPFGNGDEIIYAQSVAEMVASGDWGTLTWQGAAGMLRPPLPFVFSAWSSEVIGGELGLRLPMALASLATLALIYLIALRKWGSHPVGFLAATLCASVPSFYLFSRALFSDPWFVLAIAVAIYGTAQGQSKRSGLFIAAIGIGAAIAFKSLAAGIPALALSPWLLRAQRRHGSAASFAGCVGIVLALGAPFFVYSWLRFGSVFVDEHIGLSLGNRFSGKGMMVGMTGGVTSYVQHLWHADGPLVSLWMLASVCGTVVFRRTSGLLFAGAGLLMLVLFSLMSTRLPHYILPIYPMFALAMAGTYAEVCRRAPRLTSPVAVSGLAAAMTMILLLGIVQAPRDYLLPSEAAVRLGKTAADQPVSGPIYTLDWYAPAAGYYSKREWRALYSVPQQAEAMGQVYLFRKAGNITTVPPWPAGEFLLIGDENVLPRLGFRMRDIASANGYLLVLTSAQ